METFIALYGGFVPRHCPNCGEETRLLTNGGARDFLAKASHTCRDCGLHFQSADERRLLEVAGEDGGDMPHYVKL